MKYILYLGYSLLGLRQYTGNRKYTFCIY